MFTYIVLLRGINVGGKGILPMRNLCSIVESLGCENIKTYIQSGNLVFNNSTELPTNFDIALSLEIEKIFNFKPGVFIFSLADFKKIIANNPFSIENGKIVHFYFLSTKPKNPDLEKLNSLKTETEQFKLLNQVLYLIAPDGIGRSKLASQIEKVLKTNATARNFNTINKLLL